MIISFSGTGNSFYAAQILAERLGLDGYVKLQGEILVAQHPREPFDVTAGDCVVWVFPTYSWGVPPVVKSFIERCDWPQVRDVTHHLVVTCGDDIGLLVKQWRSLLKTKGWQPGGAWSVQMPNTYTLMKGFDTDPLHVEEEKLLACVEHVGRIADRIASGSCETDVATGRWAWIKTAIINPWFKRFDMSPKPFYAADNCISCGLCEEQCPTCNITMWPVNDPAARPRWSSNCALCLRCYHQCPVNAIQYGKATRGKGQYKIAKVLQRMNNDVKH